MARGDPVGDVAMLLDRWPAVLEVEAADAFRDAERKLVGDFGVLVARRVVVVQHDDVSPAQLLAVLLRPLRRLARLGSPVRVAGRSEAQQPQIVDSHA